MIRKVQIKSIAKVLPKKKVLTSDIEKDCNLEPGTIENKIGIKYRYYAVEESSVDMGAEAARIAIDKAGINIDELDLIVSASAIMYQPVPNTSSYLQKALGLENSGIPCIDVNTTCLSFFTAFDVFSGLIEAGIYKNILIVSSEKNYNGLNWDFPEAAALLGDGACATILSPSTNGSKILSSKMVTYSRGADYVAVYGGGNNMMASEFTKENRGQYQYMMEGPKIYKLAFAKTKKLIQEVLMNANISMDDIDMFVMHQASGPGMAGIKKVLKIPDEKFITIVETHGNTVAASLPMTLYQGITDKRIKRGDKVFLFGTGAGLSMGCMVLEY